MVEKKPPALQTKPYLMRNSIQNYPWGTRDENAIIPQLIGEQPEPGKPYAELWMGAHPTAPSALLIAGEYHRLDQLIDQYPDFFLGKKLAQEFKNRLPFLLKILSVGQPLSIQAHPDKSQAEKLHATAPQHYPDDNHKPEIAIALDQFQALVGFKSSRELVEVFTNYPEIAEICDPEIVAKIQTSSSATIAEKQANLKTFFSHFMHRSQEAADALKVAIEKLKDRLQTAPKHSPVEALFLAMYGKYRAPDTGLFSLFFLNLINLQPGEAVFIKAGIPHAYLSGTVIECMANSDNVVRAGFTSKFQDKNILHEILTYESGAVSIIGGIGKERKTTYETEAKEFILHKYHLQNGDNELLDSGKPGIILVLAGKIELMFDTSSEVYHKGQSVLIPACLQNVQVIAKKESRFYIATVP
ncbi:MAG: mannose-6-phosphate isomerase, class I [Calditrichaeota bacterium]|nr:MAG: mannose-6-phosphate isomerase, class I [Calditrichota bacterium]